MGSGKEGMRESGSGSEDECGGRVGEGDRKTVSSSVQGCARELSGASDVGVGERLKEKVDELKVSV